MTTPLGCNACVNCGAISPLYAMPIYECRECANQVTAKVRPKVCPGCGEERTLFREDGWDDRERDEDDGSSYGHPGDRLRGYE